MSETSRRAARRATGPRKGERRQQAVLDALEQLLATVPFAEITIDDIARHAGISRSSMYFYFASKEDVLSALHQRTYETMSETMGPLLADETPVAAAMRDAIERVGANWREHRHALRTFHEFAMVAPAFGQEWRQRLEQHVAALTAIIERERAAGRADSGPPPAPAIAGGWFWMLEQQFYDLFGRDHTRREEAELVDTLLILWLRMTAARG
jgi:AcrR family transcriptional regulator